MFPPVQNFPGDFSELDGALRQRRQELEESSSSDSQAHDYDKVSGSRLTQQQQQQREQFGGHLWSGRSSINKYSAALKSTKQTMDKKVLSVNSSILLFLKLNWSGSHSSKNTADCFLIFGLLLIVFCPNVSFKCFENWCSIRTFQKLGGFAQVEPNLQ